LDQTADADRDADARRAAARAVLRWYESSVPTLIVVWSSSKALFLVRNPAGSPSKTP